MLKKVIALATGAALLASVSYAEPAVRVQIDGKALNLEVSPVVENGRTLVPFRAIFEALGLQVDWNDDLRMATAYNGDTTVSVKLDAPYGSVNGELKALDAPARISAGRTLVPLRFVSEAFGNEVKWNAATRTVSITSGFKPYVYSEALPVVGSFEKLRLILDYAGKYTQPVYRLMESAVPAPAAAEKSAVTADSAAGGFSTTNIQVAGVDEGDIVKTDGNAIYQLRSNDLKITAAGVPLKALTTLRFEEGVYANDLYLYNGKLIVIGTRQSFMPYGKMAADARMIMPMQSPETQVLMYDVKNPANPVLLKKYTTDGSYMTSRLTGGRLYLIANKWLNSYEMTEQNVLPRFTDSSTGKTTTLGFEELRYFPDSVEANLMITLGFDLDNPAQEPHKAAYLGSGSNVYADTTSLIVALDRYQYRVQPMMTGEFAPAFDRTTDLFKFNLSGGTVRFSAKGSVPGSVLNQFSMDAYNGNYRIATTTGETWGNADSKNNLYVLDSGLKLKGKLEGLAPGERIYSARFMGSRAYLVTFRQVDPFYVIDLKDPTAPKVLGYLKLPGYSDYLHPYDGNTVIGFGKETIDTANGPITGGLKIALFDVTNVAQPVEKSHLILGSSGSWSEVLNNHKALLFSKEKNLFALPVSLYEGLGRDNRFAFQGAYVYSVDPAKGFVLKGKSTHLTDAEIRDTDLKWYDQQKDVKRILWIGETLYTLSDYGIKAHDLDTLKQTDLLVH